MADKSKIEWTDATWNPLRGCSRVSEGCRNCYAEGVAARFSGPGLPYEGLAKRVTRPDGSSEARWTGKVAFSGDQVLTQPLRWKKPRRIFVNSMSDLFHESVPDAWIDRIFAVMALAPQHTFQVLTKRPERMKAYMLERWQSALAHRIDFGHGDALDVPAETVGEDRRDQVARECEDLIRQMKLDDTERDDLWDEQERLKIMQWTWPLPNVWLGTSVEDQVTADTRIPYLLSTPAAVRFISAEPLLGPIDLSGHIPPAHLPFLVAGTPLCSDPQCRRNGPHYPREFGCRWHEDGDRGTALPGLDWVIAGGESGAGARPMHPDWARSLRDQWGAAGVAFLYKQWGEWAPGLTDGDSFVLHTEATERLLAKLNLSAAVERSIRVGKKRAGRLLDGVEHNGFPEARHG